MIHEFGPERMSIQILWTGEELLRKIAYLTGGGTTTVNTCLQIWQRSVMIRTRFFVHAHSLAAFSMPFPILSFPVRIYAAVLVVDAELLQQILAQHDETLGMILTLLLQHAEHAACLRLGTIGSPTPGGSRSSDGSNIALA